MSNIDRTQKGFTLIELVFVIVILGILAAFAVPRFIDLTTQARAASIQGLGGSVQSAAALAHAQWLANGNPSATSISMDGQTVQLSNGYPTAASTGIEAAMQDLSGYSTTANGSDYEFTIQGSGLAVGNCGVVYTNDGTNPVSTAINTGGC